jgi:hypothetical protein
MKKTGIQIKGGFAMTKTGKLAPIPGYGLNASAKIAQKKSKRIKPAKGQKR